MPTTDTFIIPPMQTEEEPKKEKKEKKEKKKSGGNKTFLFIGLVLLIISLPVAIYFITQQQQIADTRSRAAGCICIPVEVSCAAAGMNSYTGNCMLGTKAGHCCQNTDQIPTLKPKPTATPTTKPSTSTGGGTGGGTGGTPTGRTATNSFAGCGYLEKPPLSGLKPCDSNTCGGDCGVYTYDCGQWCFDKECGGNGCQAIAAKEAAEAAAATPTVADIGLAPDPVEPTPTQTPTTAPTSAPNSSQCDASCSTDSNCISGLSCASVNGINRCRNASCPAESSCNCPSAANTPEPTSAPNDETAYADTTTGDAMPVSGIGPGIIGSLTVVGSIFLLLIGLAL